MPTFTQKTVPARDRLVCLILGLVWIAGAAAQSPASLPHADELIASTEPGWPQWRGPYRDGISDEKGLMKEWPVPGPALLWERDGLGKGWSSPIVVNGRIYITGDIEGDLVIWAFDVDGRLQWQAANGKAWEEAFPGARAACAYSEGRLYHLNAHGRLACLDAATGKEIWAAEILERFEGSNIQWALSECLLVDGPRVIATPGGKKALMAALDKRTGETVWTTENPGDDRTAYSSPILFRYGGRRLIAHCSASHGFGADADSGDLVWRVPLKNRFGTNISTPIYGAGAVYYVTPFTELGRLYRLRAEGQKITLEEAWTHPLDTVTGSGVFLDGTLYSAGYRKPKWWFAVDWKTGETKHEFDDLTTGAAIYADERLYCLDEKGNVALLNPPTLEVKGRFTLPLEQRARDAWAHPVLCDGRLYLRYHDKLWCYDVAER
ncbi:MAG: PQQ-binding-like beta-propeller repeat protein [Rhodopirellula sp.]|nr:PQQ-binding-like beta-propeller repeat protein [Rhodopirellula sp.]